MSNIDSIRDKNDQELLEELTNINRDMLDLKFKLETKQLANAFEIKKLKKDKSRILTVIQERKILRS
ncbi:MAG: 50S ribosomal protein L29 [Chloroflexi bacterium]|jgi:ribosomal protein L29|nr:50S ribosomal protein L29 [Chloroflexota bacterium]|tara:strand:- start:644 stop:844 length:201 start_codon:yes stop_codon:yes gene_type:complete